MTRSQIIALLFGSCCVILVAGFAWRAYAPDELAAKLPLASSESSRESTVAAEPPKEPQTRAPNVTADKPAEPPAPQSKGSELAVLPPAATQPRDAETTAPPVPARPKASDTVVLPAQPMPENTAPLRKADETKIARPEFDVVRVEPSGEAVVAGRGRAKTKIQLLAGGKVLAEAMTDISGQFVVTPKLPPGSYELILRDGAVPSTQSVAVSVARKPDEKTVAVLAEPGKPSIVLTTRPPADKAKDAVAFISAEVDKNAFYATGDAKPNAHVRLYADEKALADVTAGADGRWSLRLENRLAAGRHQLRADSVDPAGKVVARAEIPFEAPVEIVDGKAETALLRTDQPSPAEAAKFESAVVQRGDNLWRISKKLLGSGERYTEIYDANTAQIRNPRLIYPGQVFLVPGPGQTK